MRQPTVTLAPIAPSVTLTLGDAYNVLLEENGDPLLAEDGTQLIAETFAVPVTLSTIAPSVALVLIPRE